jgi:hypothetical protein
MSETDHCKVDRLIEKYDLNNLNKRILRRYKKEDASLRDLENYVCKQVLGQSMKNADMNRFGKKQDYYYRLIQSSDKLDNKTARDDLSEFGISVDEVKSNFVSYQTIRKHLNVCLNQDTSKNYTPRPTKEKQHIVDLRGRCKSVINRTIERLRKHDIIEMGEPEVMVSFKIRCEDCGQIYSVHQLFNRRRCNCPQG